MPFWKKTLDLLLAARALQAAAAGSSMPARLLPRSRDTAVTSERALSLSIFYKGVMTHVTAVSQLSLAVERGGSALDDPPAIIVKPDIDTTRSAFLEYTTTSLYLDGNAFWLKTLNPRGVVVNLRPLNPAEVTVMIDRDDSGNEKTYYGYRGEKLDATHIQHLQLLRVPGIRRGLGPVQAATLEILGALDARDYGSMWLRESSMPDGVLTTDQELGAGDAEKYKNIWYGRNPDGSKKENLDAEQAMIERLRVLGKGLTYTPLLLKPSDLQFLETQQFTELQMARLVGAPASVMLISQSGSSQTYQNVEQEWIAYVRFGLMKALREIEEAFTEVLPRGQVARFKIDALLRTDTLARYQAYAVALDKNHGWATIDEIRGKENMSPLTPEQREEIEARRTATTTKDDEDE